MKESFLNYIVLQFRGKKELTCLSKETNTFCQTSVVVESPCMLSTVLCWIRVVVKNFQ